jgi:hypothetical protein
MPKDLQMQITLTPFTENDWHGFYGAEEFVDSSQPLIGEMWVDGIEAVIVVSKVGISIVYEYEDKQIGLDVMWHDLISMFDFQDDQHGAKEAAKLIGYVLTKRGNRSKLESIGFANVM